MTFEVRSKTRRPGDFGSLASRGASATRVWPGPSVAFASSPGSPTAKSLATLRLMAPSAADVMADMQLASRAKLILQSIDSTDPESSMAFTRQRDAIEPAIIDDMPDYHKRHRKPVAVPQLRELDISMCTDVTDEGLSYIVSRCTKLQVRALRCSAVVLEVLGRTSTSLACSASAVHS